MSAINRILCIITLGGTSLALFCGAANSKLAYDSAGNWIDGLFAWVMLGLGAVMAAVTFEAWYEWQTRRRGR